MTGLLGATSSSSHLLGNCFSGRGCDPSRRPNDPFAGLVRSDAGGDALFFNSSMMQRRTGVTDESMPAHRVTRCTWASFETGHDEFFVQVNRLRASVAGGAFERYV